MPQAVLQQVLTPYPDQLALIAAGRASTRASLPAEESSAVPASMPETWPAFIGAFYKTSDPPRKPDKAEFTNVWAVATGAWVRKSSATAMPRS